MKIVLATMAAAFAGAVTLTPDNWASETAGKTVFVKFQAPWWGHCKKMKPDWDKLMTEYDGSKTTLVGDVDCTAEGKPLCDKEGVKGFPTIKHGVPAALEDYQGGRDFDALKKFADGLKPLCSPSNMDLCDADQKKKIEEVMALSDAELDAKISAADKKTSDAEKTFETELQKLQDAYKKLQENKESALAEVKASGIGMVRAVKASRGAAGKTEL